LGTSKYSSTIDSVFNSIQQQLESIFKINLEDPEYQNIKAEDFHEKLVYISNKYLTDSRLILLLDSIDQLSKNDYDVKWLFTDLPKGIKILFSVLNDYEDILKNLKKKIKEDNILELNSLTIDKSKDMLDLYLKGSNGQDLKKFKRKLTDKQRHLVHEMIGKLKNPIPLQIKLIYDIVSKWKSSFTPPVDFIECQTSIEIIKYLFKRIQNEIFGNEILFKHCLFYLTLFEYRGISENELEDILSIDDKVLESIFIHHHPPVRRFPMALWYRMKYEFKDFITHKMTDDTSVIAW